MRGTTSTGVKLHRQMPSWRDSTIVALRRQQSETTTESTKEKRLSAKEKKALKKKKAEEDAEKDVFDQTQQKYYLPQVGSYLIMEFEGKAYVVLVEKFGLGFMKVGIMGTL